MAASPSHDDFDMDSGTLDTIFSNDGGEITSLQSSPHAGPSRSASLKIRASQRQRVAFTDAMRQSSLPSTDCETNFPDSGGEWPTSSQNDDSELSEAHILEVDGEQVELRKKSPNHPPKQQV